MLREGGGDTKWTVDSIHVRAGILERRNRGCFFWNADAPVHILNVDKYVEAAARRPSPTAAAESGLSYNSTTVFNSFY